MARAADVSKPAVYSYFDSKEALVRALVIECTQLEVAALCAAIEAAPPEQPVVSTVLRAYAEHHLKSLHLFRADHVFGQVVGIDAEQVESSINDARRLLPLTGRLRGYLR